MNTAAEDGKSFATMMIERKGRDKQAYIVWVNFYKVIYIKIKRGVV
jgi:hypothetical protein